MRLLETAIATNPTVITLSDGDNDLFVAAGSPAVATAFVFVIPSAVILGGATGLTTGGAWPVSSTILITNNGKIRGIGGIGGSPLFETCGDPTLNGNPGLPGGSALILTYDVTIDNTNGEIFGGGGGGGSGVAETLTVSTTGTGGGGGGGQSFSTVAGGTGNGGGSCATVDSATVSQNGGTGENTGAGAGGSGGLNLSPNVLGGLGGTGGAWGAVGFNGGVGSGGDSAQGAVGVGGAAGDAVESSGGVILAWLGGENAAQVKGAY